MNGSLYKSILVSFGRAKKPSGTWLREPPVFITLTCTHTCLPTVTLASTILGCEGRCLTQSYLGKVGTMLAVSSYPCYDTTAPLRGSNCTWGVRLRRTSQLLVLPEVSVLHAEPV